MSDIVIEHAREGNLKDITVSIPKNAFTVVTGLSGSGKSTLVVDVLFNECQRLYLEALGMEGIRKPRVERVRGAAPAILIGQGVRATNPRSTVGTLTNVYTDLRMVFEKLHVRTCPACGETICAADCPEETEKRGDEFFVFMRCCACGHRMPKLTRTEFSFNTKEGACPTCEGLGRTMTVDLPRVLDETRSLEEGAVDFWVQRYRDYMIEVLHAAYRHYGLAVPAGRPVVEFDELQRAILLEGVEGEAVRAAFPEIEPPKTVAKGRFEGLIPLLRRRLAEKEGDERGAGRYFASTTCPSCGGERLGELARAATVEGTRLPELVVAPLERILDWAHELDTLLPAAHRVRVEDYLRDIQTKIVRYLRVGLGYLTLDRQTATLSGGELQRLRLAAVLDSELTGVLYLLDEPTVGLHPRDTAGLVEVLQALRDRGNVVVVIEHDPDVMRAADHVIDLGPGAGAHGGQVVATGTLAQIEANPNSLTGRWLRASHPAREKVRHPQGEPVRVRNATLHNLKALNVDIPTGCFTAVTGPSGSGKSTLVFGLIAQGDGTHEGGTVKGCAAFDRVVEVGQAPLARMKRSNVATYSGAYADIRALFAATEAAKQANLTARHFSFNAAGGRCERCEGLGTVTSNLLFFLDAEVTCPACGGRRFSDEVLAVELAGKNVDDVLRMSVEEAAAFFATQAINAPAKRLVRTLDLLKEVGLGYLLFGQTLTTLSGGEGQRLKLARELLEGKGRTRGLYLLDEPTCGLHPWDVERFLALVDRLVDAGGTVVVVEHNPQVIAHADHIIDLGPDGGDKGGELLFSGPPAALRTCKRSATAMWL